MVCPISRANFYYYSKLFLRWIVPNSTAAFGWQEVLILRYIRTYVRTRGVPNRFLSVWLLFVKVCLAAWQKMSYLLLSYKLAVKIIMGNPVHQNSWMAQKAVEVKKKYSGKKGSWHSLFQTLFLRSWYMVLVPLQHHRGYIFFSSSWPTRGHIGISTRISNLHKPTRIGQ